MADDRPYSNEYYRFAHGLVADPERGRGRDRFDPAEARRRKRQRAAEDKAVGHAANVADLAQQDFDFDDYMSPVDYSKFKPSKAELDKAAPIPGRGRDESAKERRTFLRSARSKGPADLSMPMPEEETVKAPSWLSSLFTRKPSTVEVKKGDSLSAIAKRRGIKLADMLKANSDLKNPNLIKPGQLLKLPKGAK